MALADRKSPDVAIGVDGEPVAPSKLPQGARGSSRATEYLSKAGRADIVSDREGVDEVEIPEMLTMPMPRLSALSGRPEGHCSPKIISPPSGR